MAATHRLFIGLWPTADVIPALMERVRAAHQVAGGYMMRPDTLHLTLAFLGHVELERTRELIQASKSWRVDTGRITLRRIGRFDRPGVVWAGPDPDQPEWLFGVYDRLWDKLSGLGWARPDRPFRPHVSLLRQAGAVANLNCPPISWISDQAVLVASTPQAGKSCYQVLSHLAVAA